jgi:hypothetical protein
MSFGWILGSGNFMCLEVWNVVGLVYEQAHVLREKILLGVFDFNEI